MAPLVRGSIFRTFAIAVSCLLAACAATRLAWAQHAPGHVGGGVHVSAPPVFSSPILSPPISRAPISRPPTVHAPISYAPISTPRISIAPRAGALGIPILHSPRPIRPFPPVIRIYSFPVVGPFWGFNSCWWGICNLFWPWTVGSFYESAPTNYFSLQASETPVYVYGEERPELPQLYLKDGSIVNVNDYWIVDDQLHFKMIEEDGAKPEEQVIPFEALDLQKTVDLNTRRGFRFVLRNEPVDEYLRDHPDEPPPAVAPAHE